MNRLTSSATALNRADLRNVRSCSRLKVRLCRTLGSASLLLLSRHALDMMCILTVLRGHCGMMLLVPGAYISLCTPSSFRHLHSYVVVASPYEFLARIECEDGYRCCLCMWSRRRKRDAANLCTVISYVSIWFKGHCLLYRAYTKSP